MCEKSYGVAIDAYQAAVTAEENMVYNEPRDWLLSARHYLADALLRSGQPAKAFEVLKYDLKRNNENGWALFGSWQALVAQKKNKEAAAMLIRFHKAFDKADVKLYGAVF